MENKFHGSPTFYNLLDEMAKTHDAKSHDYAKDKDPYGNYKFAGWIASLFSHSPDDAGFAGRLAEKIFRLSVLEGGNLNPKNESIEDTERDIAVIATLWMSARRDSRKVFQAETSNQYTVSDVLRDTCVRNQYDVGERYPGPEAALGCDENGVKSNPEHDAVSLIIKAERDMSPSTLLDTIKYLSECYHSRLKVSRSTTT